MLQFLGQSVYQPVYCNTRTHGRVDCWPLVSHVKYMRRAPYIYIEVRKKKDRQMDDLRTDARPSDYAYGQTLTAFICETQSRRQRNNIQCVSKKRHCFGLLQLPRTSIDFDNFWHKCCLESKQANGTLFSHLA